MSTPEKPTEPPEDKTEAVEKKRRPLPSGPRVRNTTKEFAGRGFGIMVPSGAPKPKDPKKD